MANVVAPCLSEEELADVLEHGLGADHARAEAHLASCAHCRRVVSASIRLRGEHTQDTDEQERIGRYAIVREVGAGAMGVVYAARDDELDRLVAVKLLRPLSVNSDLAAHEASLRREAQAMARVTHPGVVHVYEIGHAHDQLFIVMELIDGQSLSSWLAEAPRDERAIVRTFIEAGRGLIAAHEQGLVHRDFKPDNVLVGRDGRVCVADFGIARVGHEQGGRATTTLSTHTETNAVAGTPAYMAPEVFNGEAGNARSDQFSYVVSLCEALRGQRPYVAENISQLLNAMQEERQTPPDPRRRESRWLQRVIGRGLAFDPARRFPSMQALVDTLERGVAPARWLPRVLALVACAALVAFAWAVRRHHASAPCVHLEARIANLLTPTHREQIRTAFVKAAPAFGADTFRRVMAALDRYAAEIDTARASCCGAKASANELSSALRLACLDRRVDEASALVQLFTAARAEGVTGAVHAAESLSSPSICLRGERTNETVPAPAALADLRAHLIQVRADDAAGAAQEGLAEAERCAAVARKLGSRVAEAEAFYELGVARTFVGDRKGAEAALRDASSAAEASHLDELAARAWIDLVELTCDTPTESARNEERARAAVERVGSPDELMFALLRAVGQAHSEQSRFSEAVTAYRAALVHLERLSRPHALLGAELESKLALTLSSLARPDDALAAATRALEIDERALGAVHPQIATDLIARGTAYTTAGRYAEAERDQRRALEIRRALLPPKHPQLASALADLATAIGNYGDPATALPYIREAMAIDTANTGADGVDMAYDLSTYGFVLENARMNVEAEAAYRRALALFQARLGPKHVWVGITYQNLGHLELASGAAREALAAYESAAAVYRAGQGSKHPDLAYSLTGIGKARLALNQPELARAPLEEAVQLVEHAKLPPRVGAGARFALARALTTGDRACALAEAAHAVYLADHSPPRVGHHELEDVATWLHAHCAR